MRRVLVRVPADIETGLATFREVRRGGGTGSFSGLVLGRAVQRLRLAASRRGGEHDYE